MSRVVRIFLLWISLLMISSCLVSPPYVVSQPSWTPDYWPTDGWRVSSPEAQHISSGHLFAMRNFLSTHPYSVDSVLVIRNGYIVYEDYPTGHTVTMRHTLYSVTKSVTSAVMGIALGQGYFNGTQDRLLDFFPNRTITNLDQRKRAITVENLLTMKAGFEWDEWSVSYEDGDNPAVQLYSSLDGVQMMLDRPMATQPGTTWVYNSGASHLLSGIINASTGRVTSDFAQEYLFDPLGITSVFWDADLSGVNFGGFGLNLCPRDMAKLGYLFLNDGVWDGDQIIPTSWVEASTTLNHSMDFNSGYGYQWWLNPEWEAFSARGYKGQRIHVLPNENLVVVFTASQGHVNYDSIIEEYILPAVNEYNPLLAPPQLIGLAVAVALGIPIIVVIIYLIRRHR